MNLTEKTLKKIYKFKGRILNVRQDEVEAPDGSIVSREVIEHNGGVCIAAVTDENELLLVRHFRYPLMKEIIEVPAGKLEPGKNPLHCATRELLEETGFTAQKIELLDQMYPSPGYSAENIYIFKATGLQYKQQQLDEGEFLDVIKLPLEEAYRQVLSNEIADGKTQIAVLRLFCQKA